MVEGGEWGPHVTITHDALDLTVKALPQTWDMGTPQPQPPQTWDMGIPHSAPMLVTSGGHHWRPVETCSSDLIVQLLGTDI